MANNYTVTKTNYFEVTDEEKFRNLMQKVCAGEDKVVILNDGAEPSKRAFGAYDSINGFTKDGDWYETGYDDFCKELGTLLPDGEACVIMEVGHCKLRDVFANCTIITNKEVHIMDMEQDAEEMAGKMLKNPDWRL